MTKFAQALHAARRSFTPTFYEKKKMKQGSEKDFCSLELNTGLSAFATLLRSLVFLVLGSLVLVDLLLVLFRVLGSTVDFGDFDRQNTAVVSSGAHVHNT
eukprot:SAG11_NODE_115_length_16019_cov_12.462940_9_plen_100_part_00